MINLLPFEGRSNATSPASAMLKLSRKDGPLESSVTVIALGSVRPPLHVKADPDQQACQNLGGRVFRSRTFDVCDHSRSSYLFFEGQLQKPRWSRGRQSAFVFTMDAGGSDGSIACAIRSSWLNAPIRPSQQSLTCT